MIIIKISVDKCIIFTLIIHRLFIFNHFIYNINRSVLRLIKQMSDIFPNNAYDNKVDAKHEAQENN